MDALGTARQRLRKVFSKNWQRRNILGTNHPPASFYCSACKKHRSFLELQRVAYITIHRRSGKIRKMFAGLQWKSLFCAVKAPLFWVLLTGLVKARLGHSHPAKQLNLQHLFICLSLPPFKNQTYPSTQFYFPYQAHRYTLRTHNNPFNTPTNSV